MPIPYSLQRDPLHQTGVYHAHVLPGPVLGVEEMIDRMSGAGTTLSRADLAAALALLEDTVAQVLAEGGHVNLPFCRLRPTIRGKFAGLQERFDPSRHEVTVVASAGAAVKRRLRGTPVQRSQAERGVDRPRPGVFLGHGEDGPTGDLTPGGFGEVRGRRLKFDPEGEGEGVFFLRLLPEGGLAGVPPVSAGRMAVRTEQRLLFQVPVLEPGAYRCVVRRRFGRQGTLLREGTLQQVLTVV